ncbi:MAG: tetratricopeptide repeat protein [Acidobacteria bacterium]|nr:tetratricopeptide repeat protein [Acidobacteriota bacterium]
MPSGNLPEQRLRVVLEHSAGGIVSETFSDTAGNFEFRGLTNNTYRVTVPTDHYTYETGQESVEVFGNYAHTVSVQIYLKEKDNNLNVMTKDKLLSPADIQEVPKNAKKAYDQGVKLARDKQPEKASAKFQEALQIFPEYLNALNKLGEQMAILNKPDLAEANFERAIAINPKFASPYINSGIVLVSQKRYDEAISTLETGNRLDDSFPMGHLNLGIALMSKTPADFDQAEKELMRVLDSNKKEFAYVRKLLFNLNIRQRKYDKAVAQLEAYLKEFPDAPDSQEVKLTLEKVKKAMAQQAAANQKSQ